MENNNKLLIVKIIILVLVISALVISLFFLLSKDKIETYTVEDENIKVSMLQLKEIAENFKESKGYYSEGVVSNSFCELNENFFMGVGNGHILCSNIVNQIPGNLMIKINADNYCISKGISEERKWCMDNNGYLNLSSGCGEDYRCK
ncbi:MAG: hypothetical protein PHU17_00685 [Candidatus Pacebacteria bacterium]|nr:hypothetical protein [Candidatus Paceibacterota bacterium]